MKLKKTVKILMSFVVFLFIASASQAATFNLTLSNLNNSYSDIEVYSLVFAGFPELTVEDDGAFTETGVIPTYLYTTSSGGDVLNLGISGLTLEFTDLRGDVDENGILTFDDDQYVYFRYNGDTVATFSLLEDSGGLAENAVTQTYYLELMDGSELISGASDFESLIVASSFSGQYQDGGVYFMSGEVFAAVPAPHSLLLISSGLCCLVGLRRKA
nr:hypothetical protein [uncultured Desulfobacter sp.]